jgi:hypothetical protein
MMKSRMRPLRRQARLMVPVLAKRVPFFTTAKTYSLRVKCPYSTSTEPEAAIVIITLFCLR